MGLLFSWLNLTTVDTVVLHIDGQDRFEWKELKLNVLLRLKNDNRIARGFLRQDPINELRSITDAGIFIESQEHQACRMIVSHGCLHSINFYFIVRLLLSILKSLTFIRLSFGSYASISMFRRLLIHVVAFVVFRA